MTEQLRVLGITLTLPGAGLMEEFIKKKKRPDDLNRKQIRQVLEAWDSRYVPKINVEVVDRVKPSGCKEEDIEKYEKDYVDLIYEYLRTM